MRKKFWSARSMLEDGCDGSLSSKRVITLIAFILCSIAFMVDVFTMHDVKKELFDSMIYLVIAGLGFTASEKFAGRNRHDYRNNYYEGDGNNTDQDSCQSYKNNI